MPTDVQRNLGPSSSQSVSYEAIGHSEDLTPILYNIDPEQTLFLPKFGTTKPATELDFTWMTKGLRPPQDNAHLEMEDYAFGKVGSIQGMSNNIQRFQNSGYVTDDQNLMAKAYNNEHGSDLDDAKFDAILGQSKDIEYMLVTSNKKVAGDATTPARSGGVPFFMQLSNEAVTIDTTTGIFTVADTLHLQTGDVVYFTADKIPGGLKSGLVYYIRTDDTNPTTKFTIYNTMQGAIEKDTTQQVIPTDSGTKPFVVKNNVIALDGKTDFTLDDINNAMEMAFRRGGNPTEMFISGRKYQAWNKLVLAQTTTQRSKDKSISMVATTYTGAFGTINANIHPLYPDNRIDILDMQYWDNRFFTKTHEVQGLPKTGTYDKFVVETKMGLQGTQPKASCSIINIPR